MKMNRIKLHKQVETMNKEQLLDLCKSTTSIIDDLQDKIDKVIEYIESNEKEYGSLEDNEKIILDILRGEDNVKD